MDEITLPALLIYDVFRKNRFPSNRGCKYQYSVVMPHFPDILIERSETFGTEKTEVEEKTPAKKINYCLSVRAERLIDFARIAVRVR